MHIDNPDALKIWLTNILEPLCEADPAALARYVLALLKKDKVVDELSQCMSEQLDVFLGQETAPFLSRLFKAIETKEYLHDQAVDSNQLAAQLLSETTSAADTVEPHTSYTPSDSAASHSLAIRDASVLPATSLVRESTPPLTISSHSDILIEHASPIVSPVVSPVSKSQLLSSASDLSPASKTIAEGHAREMRRRRASNRSRSRTRSRSFERERKIADREKTGSTQQQYRNKSPSAGGKGSDRRPYERRGERRGNNGGANSSWKSRSRSPERRKMLRSQSPNDDEPKAKRQRCRDFEEKGYCMRGETCPWDHGIDPVVLEDLNNPALISIQSSTVHGRGAEYSPDAPEMWTRGASFGGRGNNNAAHRGGPGSTYPRATGATGGGNANFRGGPPAQFPFPVNASAITPLQRELISVPVVDGNQGGDVSAPVHQKRRYEPEDTVAVAEGPTKRKLPINSRLGPRVGGGGGGGANGQQNCSLELRKVPRGLNSIAHLNNHFTKFGKIVNIQISYDGDAEAAIVTFSTHAEANVAYRSTEAVLNNRFIKVFWHSGQTTTTDGHAKDSENGSQHIRHKSVHQYSLNNTTTNVHANNGHSAVPAVPTAAAAQDVQRETTAKSSGPTPSVAEAALAEANLRARNHRVNRAATEIIRKKQEEKVKAAVVLGTELQERKHKLLHEYLKEIRAALDLIERTDNTDPQRGKLMATVKTLQVKVDDLRKEIQAEQAKRQPLPPPVVVVPVVRKSVEEQKKELLDIELELIGQKKTASNNPGIRQRLEELQRSLGVSKPAPGHSTGARNPRVRPAPPGSTSVDRRPTTLQVSGFDADDSDALLGHFKHFGEVTKNELDTNVPSLVISFATRINAEQAMLRGRTFKDVTLQISWVTVPTAITLHPKGPQNAKLVPDVASKEPSVLQELDDELDLELDDDDIISGTGAEDSIIGNNHEKSDDKLETIDGADIKRDDHLSSTTTVVGDDSPSNNTTAPTSLHNNHSVSNSEQLTLDDEDDEEEEDDADESEDRSWRR